MAQTSGRPSESGGWTSLAGLNTIAPPFCSREQQSLSAHGPKADSRSRNFCCATAGRWRGPAICGSRRDNCFAEVGPGVALSEPQRVKLLGAIETNSLVFLCGAGLSMPPPSDLPSAVRVANTCYDRWSHTQVLPAALRDDIDQLAGHFYGQGEFITTFLHLVPWGELEGTPNKGHAAVADLLVSRGAHGTLSANFDTMIEKWAKERKVDFQGALDGQEAVNFQPVSNPLVKFHGCMTRNRHQTLWTQRQLGEVDIQGKVQSCTQWITQNLPGKHLLVVGFWTDWGYLNAVLANAFTITTATSVTVVDPSTSAALEAKAPDLWAKLNALSTRFQHLSLSGADFLDDLRSAYSEALAKKFFALGKPYAVAAGLGVDATPAGMDGGDLYKLRQDAEGLPYNRAATLRAPAASATEASLAHFELLGAGATREGAWWRKGGQAVRVVNGAGRDLASVKDAYREPATAPQPDMIICAGAFDLGVPAKLIATGTGHSVVKPAPGGGAAWLSHTEARAALGL